MLSKVSSAVVFLSAVALSQETTVCNHAALRTKWTDNDYSSETVPLFTCGGSFYNGGNQTGYRYECDSTTNPTKVVLRKWPGDWKCKSTLSADSEVVEGFEWEIVTQAEYDAAEPGLYALESEVECDGTDNCAVIVNFFYPDGGSTDANCAGTTRSDFTYKEKKFYPKSECVDGIIVDSANSFSANQTLFQYANCTGTQLQTVDWSSQECETVYSIKDTAQFPITAADIDSTYTFLIVRDHAATPVAFVAALFSTLYALAFSA